MSFVPPPQSASLFSVPLEHLWKIDFSGGMDVGLKRTTGLSRFVGDEANRLLHYVTTDDFIQQLCRQPSFHNADFQRDGSAGELECDSVVTPIVFYGPAGTGKTSLAMALVARLVSELRSRQTISVTDKAGDTQPLYLTGAEFARRFYAAIETNSVEEFRQSIVNCCALLLDDLQQLVKKQAAQKELEILLDQMVKIQRPVFIVCNALPATIDGLNERLVSRLSQGLTVPFNPPGQTARTQIARDLAAIHQIQLTDDAIDLLNEQFEVTVPRLEHLFGQIKLKQRLKQADQANPLVDAVEVLQENTSAPDDSSVRLHRDAVRTINAQMLLSLLTPGDEELQKMIRTIQKSVSRAYKLPVAELRGNSRKQTIVEARGVAIFLTRKLLGTSFLKIGNAFGNRDHSTILHSYRKIETLCLATAMADEPGCSPEPTSKTKPLTNGQKKTAAIVGRLKQELTDLFATQINVT